jgi:hypothetical protein
MKNGSYKDKKTHFRTLISASHLFFLALATFSTLLSICLTTFLLLSWSQCYKTIFLSTPSQSDLACLGLARFYKTSMDKLQLM